ncbi:hypothetical protein EYF80_046228 [Liparis tanakae]|uniref:Uncharacterized protein n=1 Tax=Liparis tanakae TaxID=230148 RepID=A0A4Z2FRM0_9TELE|nr:hypothetical protein EYF80_046228 [Liparis tanakae]
MSLTEVSSGRPAVSMRANRVMKRFPFFLRTRNLRGRFPASHPVFLSLSQFSRASLLKAAAAATLLLVSWMLAMVSADETTSISPERSPVARQPYGTILSVEHTT